MLLFLLIVSVVSTGILFSVGKASSVLWIPFILTTFLLFSTHTLDSLVRFDFITVYIVFRMFIRYYIYPLLFCMVEDKGFFLYEKSTFAILLYIFEEMITLVALDFFLSKIPYHFLVENQEQERSTNSWLIVICLFLSAIVLILFPSVRQNYQFIFNASIDSMKETDFTSSIESIGYVIVDISRLLVPLTFINVCYDKYNKNGGKKIYIILSLLAAIIPMLIIKQMSRGSSFYTCLIYIWLVIKLFGWKKTKKYTWIIVGVAIFLLLVLSDVKHGSAISSQGYTLSYAYDVVQSYVIGIGQLRNGLVTNSFYDYINRLVVAYNDIICSFPIVNRFGNPNLRYSALYNSVVYLGRYNSNAALAPLLTNMLFILGPFGIAVPIAFLFFSIKNYYLSFTKKSINKQFVLVYISVLLESGRTGSFSATVSKVLWIVIPLLLVVAILEKVRTRIK